MRPVILHFHLFKNAGTSLDALFKEQLAGRWVTREFPNGLAVNRQQVRAWIEGTPEADCFSSHTAVLPAPEIPGVSVFPVIFVRHPLDRMASAYTFERQQAEETYGSVLARNTSMRGYIEVRLFQTHDRQCRNFHTHRFAHMYDDDSTEVDRAIRAVESLPFVGVVEEFDRSLQLLQRKLSTHGFPDLVLTSVRKNASSGRSQDLDDRLAAMADELGADFYQRLVDANADDLRLYEAAVSRLHREGSLIPGD